VSTGNLSPITIIEATTGNGEADFNPPIAEWSILDNNDGTVAHAYRDPLIKSQLLYGLRQDLRCQALLGTTTSDLMGTDKTGWESKLSHALSCALAAEFRLRQSDTFPNRAQGL